MKSSGRNPIILILLFSLSNVSGASLQELEKSLGSLKVRLSSLAQKLENTSQASVVDQAQIDKLKREQQRLEEEKLRLAELEEERKRQEEELNLKQEELRQQGLKEEKERLERERIEKARKEEAKEEKKRQEEAVRLAALEQERIKERKKKEQEKAKQESIERQRKEEELRLEQEELRLQRLKEEKEKQEQERIAREEADRKRQEEKKLKDEEERVAREQEEKLRLAKEKELEEERKRQEEEARQQRLKEEQERLERERVEEQKRQEEAARLAALEQERIEREAERLRLRKVKEEDRLRKLEEDHKQREQEEKERIEREKEGKNKDADEAYLESLSSELRKEIEERKERRKDRAKKWKKIEEERIEEKILSAPKHVNIILFIDDDQAWYKLTKEKPLVDIFIYKLASAIEQNQIIICSSTIVKSLFAVPSKGKVKHWELYDTALKVIQNSELWSMYISNDPTNNFTLLIPQTDLLKGKDLEESLSFNKTYCSIIDHKSKNAQNIYEKLNGNQKIDVTVLRNLISKKPLIRKRVLLYGHGSYDVSKLTPKKQSSLEASIAGLSVSQYKDLLKHLNNSGCDFLFVASCYAGGLNLIDMHTKTLSLMEKMLEKEAGKQEEQKLRRELRDYNFILVIGSLTDMVGALKLEKDDYSKFFSKLDHFLFPRKGWIITKQTKQTLQDILSPLLLSPINNIPSVKFPGIRSFFRVLALDDTVEIITYPKLLSHEISTLRELKATAESGVKKFTIEKPLILVYPDVINIPLDIKKAGKYKILPFIVSMIPGKASHYIEEVRCDDFTGTIERFLSDMFININFLSDKKQVGKVVAPKAYFIRKIVLGNNQIFHNVLVVIEDYSKDSRERMVSFFLEKNKQFLYATGSDKQKFSSGLYSKDFFHVLGENPRLKILEKIRNFEPFYGALYHATGGRQTVPLEPGEKYLGKDKAKRKSLVYKKVENALEKVIQKSVEYSQMQNNHLSMQIQIVTLKNNIIKEPIRINKVGDQIKKDSTLLVNRIYFEDLDASVYEDLIRFLRYTFLFEHVMEKPYNKFYFIKRLKLQKNVYSNVLILISGDDSAEMYVMKQSSDIYTKYSGKPATILNLKSAGEEKVTLSNADLFELLSKFRRAAKTAEQKFDTELREALELPKKTN